MWKYQFTATVTQRYSSPASSGEAASSYPSAKAASPCGQALEMGGRQVDFKIFEIFTSLFHKGTDPQRDWDSLFLLPRLAVTHCGRAVNLTPA